MRVIDIENTKIISVNRKYTIAKGQRRLILSPEYRSFKQLITITAKKGRTFHTDCQVSIFHSSRLDVDNPCKCILDGLQEAGVLANDKIVKHLVVDVDHANTGRLTVDIEEL